MNDKEKDIRPVALVLGAAVWAKGKPSPTLRRRIARALRLWQADEVQALIGCGGLGRHAPSEAAVMAQLFAEGGVPEDRIRQENQSTSTEENLRFALPILAELETTRVIIVSDVWHLPRALMVARRLGLVATGAAPPWKGARLWPSCKAALREIPAFAYYWLTGKGR